MLWVTGKKRCILGMRLYSAQDDCVSSDNFRLATLQYWTNADLWLQFHFVLPITISVMRSQAYGDDSFSVRCNRKTSRYTSIPRKDELRFIERGRYSCHLQRDATVHSFSLYAPNLPLRCFVSIATSRSLHIFLWMPYVLAHTNTEFTCTTCDIMIDVYHKTMTVFIPKI